MKLIKGIAIYSVAILIAFFLCELILTGFKFASTAHTNPSRFTYSYIPNSQVINFTEGYGIRKANNFGFLDKDYTKEKGSGTIRAILLGNSFTEAEQVNNENVYEAILEDSLNKTSSKKIEIWNVARSGYLILDNFAMYSGFANSYPHDYVILQFNPNNPFKIFSSGCGASIKNGKLNSSYGKLESRFGIRNINQDLKEKSKTWNLLMDRAYMARKIFSPSEWFKKSKAEKAGGEDAEAFYNGKTIQKLTQKDSADMDTVLSAFNSVVKSHGAKLILFTFPVTGDPEINSFLKDICNRNGVVYIDLSPEKKNMDSGYPIEGFINSKFGDGHLNKHGHKVLAAALYSPLKAILK